MEKRYDFVIITPTCNRRELLELEMQQLVPAAEKEGISVRHLIFDDCSDDLGYASMLAAYKKDFYEIDYFRCPTRHGRKHFCALYTKMLKKVRPLSFAYAIAIADDLIFSSDFFTKTVDHFEGRRRENPHVIVMNLLWNKGGMCWGSTRHLDCAFICVRKFFDVIDWKVPQRRQKDFERRRVSTGVGRYMTQTIDSHPLYCSAEDDRVSQLKVRTTYKGVKVRSALKPW